MRVQSSWVRVASLNLLWPALLATGLGYGEWPVGSGPCRLLVGFVPGGLVAWASAHYVVRVVVQDGLVAISYPFRLRRRTWVVLTAEMRAFRVRPGVLRTFCIYLDAHNCISLPFWGLSPASLSLLQTALDRSNAR
ncbi:MAG TPA: hypothetical protein VF690_03745 [Hymenobacter sp.]|jgi:hypothetical protein